MFLSKEKNKKALFKIFGLLFLLPILFIPIRYFPFSSRFLFDNSPFSPFNNLFFSWDFFTGLTLVLIIFIVTFHFIILHELRKKYTDKELSFLFIAIIFIILFVFLLNPSGTLIKGFIRDLKFI